MTPVNRPYQAPDKFFIESGTTTSIKIKFSPKQAKRKVSWKLYNYSEKLIKSGLASIDEQATTQLKFKLSTGWYRLEFPELKYSCGIAANTPPPTIKDKFFGVDAVISWEIPGSNIELRQQLVNSIKWLGVYCSRERINWRSVNPRPGKYNFSTSFQYEQLAEMYHKADIKMLVTFHNSPEYITGKNSPYPTDLVATAEAWNKIAGKFNKVWDALEIWNEPDIRFGGFLPADQYAPLCKSISYALTNRKHDILIGGGVTAVPNIDFLNSLGNNGIFNIISFYSFHNYLTTAGMILDVNEYRRQLSHFNRSGMPIWITEAGLTFDLPKRELNDREQRLTALNIVSKSVEARAYGIARFYPFIYVYWKAYQSNKKAAMLYRDLSAGMAAAAYAHVIRTLSGTKFVGSLNITPGIIARVFTHPNSNQATIVIFTEKPNTLSELKLPFTADLVNGIDGRKLDAKTKIVSLHDGLVYCAVSFDKIKQLLSDKDKVLEQYNRSGSPDFRYYRATPPPLIIYPRPQRKYMRPYSGGWRLKSTRQELEIPIRIFNLSEKIFKVKLTYNLASTDKQGKVFQTAPQTVPSGKYRPFIIKIPVSELIQYPGMSRIVIKAVSEYRQTGQNLALPASITITTPYKMSDILKKYPIRTRLPLESSEDWNLNDVAITGANFKMSHAENHKGVRFVISFGRKEKMNEWFFPKFKLSTNIKLCDYDAILIRAKSTPQEKETSHHIILHDPYAYRTRASYLPSDGKFHTSLIKFNSLAVPKWSKEQDPNDRLDLDKVKTITIGFGNYRHPSEILEISDIYLIRTNENKTTRK